MSTSVRVNMRVDLLENDDGTFTVKVSSNSETFFGDKIVSRTSPTVRNEKQFFDRVEASKYFAEEKFKFESKE